jgi:hypothetical protein
MFLSSSDAMHLMAWLDRGVDVCEILRAIERAADARRKKQSRLPLTLGQVKRHLGKPTQGAFSGQARVPAPQSPLEPLICKLREVASTDALSERLTDLARALCEVPAGPAPQVAGRASELIREFHVGHWDSMSLAEREACRVRERDGLGDLRHLLDEAALTAIVEENARDSVRARYGWLSVATIWDLLETWHPEAM